MSTFIFITNTPWSEPPRLRHQIAQLLLDAGHRVFFFERPQPWYAKSGPRVIELTDQLTLVNTTRLMHFQLRVLPFLSWMNGRWALRQIRARLRECAIDSEARVVNFNHDSDFLGELFDRSRITTIIHDDFEAQCRLPWRSHLTRMLRRTCEMSGSVMAVSTPLVDRLSLWCTPTLFLPWAVKPYRAPTGDAQNRKTLLFWGSIDNAVDLGLVARLAENLKTRGPEWKLLFVGPTQHQHRRIRILKVLAAYPNITVRDSTPLEQLPLDEILCGILPYANTPAVNAVTLANKSMQLLAHGLPLLINAMPAFVQEPFILRFDRGATLDQTIDACSANFLKWQPLIADYLKANAPESRLRVLGATIENAP